MKTLRILVGIALLTLTALAGPSWIHCNLHNQDAFKKTTLVSNGSCVDVYEHNYQIGFQTYVHHIEIPCQ